MLSKLFDLRGQTIDVYDQAVLILKYLCINDKKGKKKNVSDPLTADQRRSGRFVSFMMTVHPYQADTNYNHSSMTCIACIQL